jgi:hypothetical protein
VKHRKPSPQDVERAVARAGVGALAIARELPPRERLPIFEELGVLLRRGDRAAVARARRATTRALRARDDLALALAVETEAEALLACALAHDPAACAAPEDPEVAADG